MRSEIIKALAAECGFELAGVAPAEPIADYEDYARWVGQGRAGEMRYLTDHRAAIRADPRKLMAEVRSIICVGKLYNGPEPYSTAFSGEELGWISRYAWGDDYHDVLRRGLQALARKLEIVEGRAFAWKVCVDTAPLLERAYARRAGLGWIGKNTCLIHEGMGSWFFLGELLVALDLEPDTPPPDRCGSCTRCIEACPTQAIVPGGSAWTLDSRRCISYLTIELRGPVLEQSRPGMGMHVFGCDICQDVCPWNRKAPVTEAAAFRPRNFAPPLERMAALTEEEFRCLFRGTPVLRSKYAGFLRNVAIAMGNAGLPRFRESLERLSAHPETAVADAARWALARARTSAFRALK